MERSSSNRQSMNSDMSSLQVKSSAGSSILAPMLFPECYYRAAVGVRGHVLPSVYFFLNRAAVGWAVSCSAFGLFLNRAAVGWAVSCSAFGLFFIFITAQP